METQREKKLNTKEKERDSERTQKKELELSLTVFAPSQCGCLFDGFVWLRQPGSICIIFTTIDVDKHVKCEIYDLNGMCTV